MANGKNTITLTESELKRVITESVKKALNEISSDMANRAYQSALDKRSKSSGTPQWGKRDQQVRKFANYYKNAYNKEQGYDGKTEGGDTFSLQFNDTLPDGSPLRVFVSINTISLKSKSFDWVIDIARLIQDKSYQKNFCILSPKTAQQVAKWFSQNRNPNYAQYTEAACNPEFWSQYYNNNMQINGFSKIEKYN